MTTSLRDCVIKTEVDLLELWEGLMGEGGFSQRSLWLIFLDREGRPTPLIVPIDELPDEPDPDDVARIARLIEHAREEVKVESVPMLLSRPGPTWMQDGDRRWAAALTEAFAGQQPQWPIHLATTDHVQVFAPDDLV
ncbi:hypothetical protein [Luteipulveratus mongoliensis]|uniref:hypothetical protein n=1 Tax=Luteipulveratus mongoliensis TaxID=571913 RepID=UPI000695C8AD|nr:hypothetical protein [Luteipulveratus mongoliensis]